jgi:sarcosine oxidase, subunit alpha
MAPRRLTPPPGAPQGKVGFRWGSRRLQGHGGDSVASALLAAGEGVLSRSIKYHRPRGYLCGVGRCANCLVTIDGKPSQRACMVPLREGMRVEGQNAWPSVRHDLFALTDAAFAKGFDPQHFLTRPRFLRPLLYHAVRRMAGLGKAPRDAAPPRTGPVAQESTPLLVVGAGPAGLAAAWEASRAGVGVRVVEESPWPGGRLQMEQQRLAGPSPWEGRAPREALQGLLTDLHRQGARLDLRSNAAGLYGDRLVAVQSPQRLAEVRAEALVLATGAPEALPLFGDNDRPGIVSAMGAMVLLHRHRVLPGERVVLLGKEPRLLDLGRALVQEGATIEAIVSDAPVPGAGDARVVRGQVVRARGRSWVKGLVVASGAETLRLDCDLVVYGEPRRPLVELAQQAGCAMAWRGGVQVPQVEHGAITSARNVFAGGDLLGPGTLEQALASGRVAGLRAAQALGAKVDEARLAGAEDALATLGGSV